MSHRRPFLLQALIAAEHAVAASAEDTAWSRIVQRYDELLTLRDSPVVRLNRAVALADVAGPQTGLDALAGVALQLRTNHRLPAPRADLLLRLGRSAEARQALEAAMALCDNEPERTHLTARLATVSSAPP